MSKRQSLPAQIKQAINRERYVKPKFVAVPCTAVRMTESVLEKLTFMVNTGKMVPLSQSIKTKHTEESLNEKPIKMVLFRSLKQKGSVRGELIILCGTDEDFAATQQDIQDNPPSGDGCGWYEDDELEKDGIPEDLLDAIGNVLQDQFNFSNDGGVPGKKARQILKKYNVDCYIESSPPNVDSACPYIEAYIFSKPASK